MARATNVEMAGLVVSALAGIGVAHALQYSVTGMALGVAAFALCETVVRVIYWRLTRPLAHLAAGETPRFQRGWQAARLHLDTIALVGLPLLALGLLPTATKAIGAPWWVTNAILFGALLLCLKALPGGRTPDQDAAAERTGDEMLGRLAPDQRAQNAGLLANGRKIEAVRDLRAMLALDLHTARTPTDRLEERLDAALPTPGAST